jgi:hypothetical protein
MSFVIDELGSTKRDIPGNALAIIGVNRKVPSLSLLCGIMKIGDKYVIFDEMALTGAG